MISAKMTCEGICTQCHQTRKLNVFKKLCENCLTPRTRVPFKRKRYESDISAKSGISALSAETQLTEIDDDDLECDGPSSDIDDDIPREETDQKTIAFDLRSVGSLSSQKYVSPIEKVGQTVPRNCASRKSLSSMSNTAQSFIGAQNRQFAQIQTNRRRHPRIRKNFSESDSGGFTQRPYINRRYSADNENLIEEGIPHDSIVVLNENLDSHPKVYVARSVKAVKSDPNLYRIFNPNCEKLYESLNDDDSGYMQHQFGRQPSRQNAQQDSLRAVNTDEELEKQNFCDKCLQSPTRFKWVLVISIVIAWAPVAVLSVLLLSSVHEGPPTSDPSSPDIGAQQQRVIEEIINQEVDKKIQGILASNSAPLRLEGVGLIEENVGDSGGGDHTHYRFKWSVPSHFVQNPISLMPNQVHMHVNMTSYYVVFCRIYYIGNQHTRQPFTVQHSLYKVNSSPNDDKLDSVTQHCMFMNDSQIEHTSTLQTLVYLEAGSQIYIRVRSTEFIDQRDYSKHMMGIFLLHRVN